MMHSWDLRLQRHAQIYKELDEPVNVARNLKGEEQVKKLPKASSSWSVTCKALQVQCPDLQGPLEV